LIRMPLATAGFRSQSRQPRRFIFPDWRTAGRVDRHALRHHSGSGRGRRAVVVRRPISGGRRRARPAHLACQLGSASSVHAGKWLGALKSNRACSALTERRIHLDFSLPMKLERVAGLEPKHHQFGRLRPYLWTIPADGAETRDRSRCRRVQRRGRTTFAISAKLMAVMGLEPMSFWL
jgi:hypothetical protein